MASHGRTRSMLFNAVRSMLFNAVHLSEIGDRLIWAPSLQLQGFHVHLST